MSVLELSKALIYGFHFNLIKFKYLGTVTVLLVDTDSLCYWIQSEDVYKEVMVCIQELLCALNFPRNYVPTQPLMRVLEMLKLRA